VGSGIVMSIVVCLGLSLLFLLCLLNGASIIVPLIAP